MYLILEKYSIRLARAKLRTNTVKIVDPMIRTVWQYQIKRILLTTELLFIKLSVRSGSNQTIIFSALFQPWLYKNMIKHQKIIRTAHVGADELLNFIGSNFIVLQKPNPASHV